MLTHTTAKGPQQELVRRRSGPNRASSDQEFGPRTVNWRRLGATVAGDVAATQHADALADPCARRKKPRTRFIGEWFTTPPRSFKVTCRGSSSWPTEQTPSGRIRTRGDPVSGKRRADPVGCWGRGDHAGMLTIWSGRGRSRRSTVEPAGRGLAISPRTKSYRVM